MVDTVNKVKISRSSTWNQSNSTSEEYTLDSNGMIFIKYSIPANDSGVYFFVRKFFFVILCYMNVELITSSSQAKYLELEENLGHYSKSESKTGQYIQAKVQTPK